MEQKFDASKDNFDHDGDSSDGADEDGDQCKDESDQERGVAPLIYNTDEKHMVNV